MSLSIPDYPDPQGAPGETIPAAHWQIDLIQIGGTSELARDAPDLSAISGRCAATVHRSLAAAQASSDRIATEEFRFGDGVIAPYADALAAGMDPTHPDHALHLKLLQAQTLLKEWIEGQVIANRHAGATVNPS